MERTIESLSERLAYQEMQEFAPTQREVQEAIRLETRVEELEAELEGFQKLSAFHKTISALNAEEIEGQ